MAKTKKRSRFFAVALVAVLMLALAVPSFANAFYPNGSSNYLNLYGSSGIQQRLLTLYSQYNGPDQQFAFTAMQVPGTTFYSDYFFNNSYQAYAVNRRSGDARAFMYYLDSSSATDSAFTNVNYSEFPAIYKLKYYDEYLCAIGTSNGSEIYFKSPYVYSPTFWALKVV